MWPLQWKCCGVIAYTDWHEALKETVVPDRCCQEHYQNCGRNSTNMFWNRVSSLCKTVRIKRHKSHKTLGGLDKKNGCSGHRAPVWSDGFFFGNSIKMTATTNPKTAARQTKCTTKRNGNDNRQTQIDCNETQNLYKDMWNDQKCKSTTTTYSSEATKWLQRDSKRNRDAQQL